MERKHLQQIAGLVRQLANALDAAARETAAPAPPLELQWLKPRQYAERSGHSPHYIARAAQTGRFIGPNGEPWTEVCRRTGKRFLIRGDAVLQDARQPWSQQHRKPRQPKQEAS